MRVLLFHTRYRELGGEDVVAAAEEDMLRQNGVEVNFFASDNQIPPSRRIAGTLELSLSSAWSRDSYRRVLGLCQQYRPDVAHVHNFWMRLTPAVHGACHAAGVPTVQTLHNFRLFCVNGCLTRAGRYCEDCLGKSPWRGVVRRCYRNSAVASAAVARMIGTNRIRRTWTDHVDAFIALSEFARQKYAAAGLPTDRILVKPNFVADPGESPTLPSQSKQIVFAGRLSAEKGVGPLLLAWHRAGLSYYGRLLIVGDGPQRAFLEKSAASLGLSAPAVEFTGRLTTPEVLELLSSARALALPSPFFENFPRILVEAFASGRPAITSHVGGLAEIMTGGRAGITYPAHDVDALGKALSLVLRDGDLADRMGRQARETYLENYTPGQNFAALMNIYRFAMERHAERGRVGARALVDEVVSGL